MRAVVQRGTVAHAYNPSMQGAEAGGLPGVCGQPQLHVETLSVNKARLSESKTLLELN